MHARHSTACGLGPRAMAMLIALVVTLGSCSSPGQTHRPPARETFGSESRGDHHFDRFVFLETAPDLTANVSIGDVNGDGNADIVLAKGRHWPLVDRVLFGDGKGAFPTAKDLGSADRSYSGRLADMDGDGDLDVVVSNDQPDPKVVYMNDGTGNFQLGSAYGRADWPTRNASIADVDGDGSPDIIVANRTGPGRGANFICLNRRNGRFDDACTEFSQESATTITPSDLNRDGRVDLVVPHRDGGQSFVYLGDAKAGYPNFQRIAFGPPDAAIRVAEVADFDGDGVPDIAVIDERRGFGIYFGEGDNRFAAGGRVDAIDVTPYALSVGDLDLDGKVDLVVGYVTAPSVVYFNDGSGRRFRRVAFGDGKGTVYGFAIGDLDKDGLPDIAVARSEAPNVVHFGQTSKSAR